MQIPAEAPLSLLLDYLHASNHLKRRKDSKPSRTRMMTQIKAFRWMALKLALPLSIALQSQTVSDFLKSQTRIPFERSEASAIPLAVLAAWEIRILSQDASLLEVITLGCFLIATMASLRFRDLLRTKPESLTIQGHILRGISWWTKTSVSGQPFTGHWVFRFLEALQLGTDKSRENWGTNWTPDVYITYILDRLCPIFNSMLLPPCSGSYTLLKPMLLAFPCSPYTRAGSKSIHPQHEI